MNGKPCSQIETVEADVNLAIKEVYIVMEGIL
jgi:hypothetical protein